MPIIKIRRTAAEYGFEATDEAGKSIRMDNSLAGGGQGYGVSPMQSLLMALGGCSGIDVVSILKKQRQHMEELDIQISGEREAGKEPSLWQKVHMKFMLKGGIDPLKAENAARLSIEKYCSVAETLRRAGCIITWEVQVTHE